jgi:hypothetical protein
MAAERRRTCAAEAKRGLGGRAKRSEQLPRATMRLEPQSVNRGILDRFNEERL